MRAMALRFAKYEGLGNDFVIVEGEPALLEAARANAVAICDRHRGVGADGVLLVSRTPEPRMVVINADGSVPQMCGNGLRCVARYLMDCGAISASTFTVQTDAGPHRCQVLPNEQVAVEMRPATLEPRALPMVSEAPIVDQAYEFAGTKVRMTAVSMGNPHAVIFDASDVRHAVGPAIAQSAMFPEGVNVGFAKVVQPGRVELHVLERGAGWTQACGTGACACAVAAVLTGRASRGQVLTVVLPGGALDIVVGEEGQPISMTGPAKHVFDGVLAT